MKCTVEKPIIFRSTVPAVLMSPLYLRAIGEFACADRIYVRNYIISPYELRFDVSINIVINNNVHLGIGTTV